MKKSMICLLLVVLLLFCAMPSLAEPVSKAEILTYQDIQVVVNGELVPVADMEPFIMNGRVYIPVDVDPNAVWDEAANTVFIEGKTVLPISAGEDIYAISGKWISASPTRFGLIKEDGTLWTWGEKYLGNGEEGRSETPVCIMSDVQAVWMDDLAGLALKNDGTLWAWGSNDNYTVGNGQKGGKQLTPVRILDHVVTAGIGLHTAAAVTEDGGLYVWGNNRDGNLGSEIPALGGPEDYLVPTRIMEDAAFVSCNGGNYGAYTMVLKKDGTLWTFGANAYGQLGNGEADLGQRYWKHKDGGTFGRQPFEWIPQQIMENVVSIYAGDRAAAAIKTDGSLWTWGCNDKGKLGSAGASNVKSQDGKPCQTIPLQIADHVASVRIGYAHHLAFLKKDGTVWVCGEYYEDVPRKLNITDVVAIATDEFTTYTLKADGTLWKLGLSQYDPAQIADITRR